MCVAFLDRVHGRLTAKRMGNFFSAGCGTHHGRVGGDAGVDATVEGFEYDLETGSFRMNWTATATATAVDIGEATATAAAVATSGSNGSLPSTDVLVRANGVPTAASAVITTQPDGSRLVSVAATINATTAAVPLVMLVCPSATTKVPPPTWCQRSSSTAPIASVTPSATEPVGWDWSKPEVQLRLLRLLGRPS